jgi:hypothetical protein
MMNPHYQALCDQADEVGRSEGHVSSLLMRRLDIPYNAAAELIARLQKLGIVGLEKDDRGRFPLRS